MGEVQRAMELNHPTIPGSTASSHEDKQHTTPLHTDLPIQRGYASLVEELNSLFTGQNISLSLTSASSSTSSSNHPTMLYYNSDCLAYRLAKGLSAVTARKKGQFSSYTPPLEVHTHYHNMYAIPSAFEEQLAKAGSEYNESYEGEGLGLGLGLARNKAFHKSCILYLLAFFVFFCWYFQFVF